MFQVAASGEEDPIGRRLLRPIDERPVHVAPVQNAADVVPDFDARVLFQHSLCEETRSPPYRTAWPWQELG